MEERDFFFDRDTVGLKCVMCMISPLKNLE